MTGSWYDTAQICTNGHVITRYLVSQPQGGQKFCDTCGAATISSCQSCNIRIKGEYHVPGVIGFFSSSMPNFCEECGTPFPWTTARLEAAKELSDDLDSLSAEDKEKLKQSIEALVRDTPQTVVATSRFKKFMIGAGKETADAFRKILVDVVSETAKKTLWLNPSSWTLAVSLKITCLAA